MLFLKKKRACQESGPTRCRQIESRKGLILAVDYIELGEICHTWGICDTVELNVRHEWHITYIFPR